MKLESLIEGLTDGSISLNKNYHTQDVIGNLQKHLDGINKAINRIKSGDDHNLILIYEDMLEVEIGSQIYQSHNYHGRKECRNCDQTCNVFVIDETHVELQPWYIGTKQYGGKVYPTTKVCDAKELIKNQKLSTIINIPTGKMIFKNVLREINKIELDDYDHSINSVLGRDMLMQDLSKYDVGYGQMSNMSIGIYLKSDGCEIIVSESNSPYNDVNPLFPDFEFKGNICLDTWRWMCCDKSVYDHYNEQCSKYENIIEMNVEKGKWLINHYFDFLNHPYDFKYDESLGECSNIYSHLIFKGV